MIAYSYDNSGLYIGSTECQLDPIESEKSGQPVYLLPASATFEPPMERTEKKVPIYSGGVWQLKTDNRGTWYDTATKRETVLPFWNSSTVGLTRAKPNGIPNERHESGQWVTIPWANMPDDVRRLHYERTIEREIRKQYTDGQEAAVKTKALAGDMTEFNTFLEYRNSVIAAARVEFGYA